MDQAELKAALAEQEEHIKRQQSCQYVVGQAHAFRSHGKPGKDKSIPHHHLWSQCIVCGVTETAKDYTTKMEANK